MTKILTISTALLFLTATTVSASIPKTTKVSDNDTTAGYLNGKLVAGSNVTFTEGSDGGNETLTISASSVDTSVSGSSFIIKTASSALPNAQVLGSLATGILKVASTTGTLSTASAATDYQSPIVAGVDYLSPTGSGAGLSGVVTSESDPIFVASAAHDIEAADIINLGNLSGTNSGDVTLAGTASYISLSGQQITVDPIDLSDSSDITGNLPITALNSGTDASSSTFWRGDGTWVAPAGSGDVTGVGDCTGGACFDGTSDGGTTITLYDGDSNTVAISLQDSATNTFFRLPTASGSNTNVLTTDGAGNLSWAAAGGHDAVTLAGTPNYLTLSTQEITLNKLDISDDTNMTAGRSLTLSTNDVAADAELYTDTKCIYLEDPTAADQLPSIWMTGNSAFTITRMWAESDQTVTMNFKIDDGTPANVATASLAIVGTASSACASGCGTTIANGAMAAGDRLDLDVSAVANTPTYLAACFTGTWDD